MIFVIKTVHYLFVAYSMMILLRILASWVPQLLHQRWMHFVIFYTDPYLNFFKRVIPPIGMIDLSAMAALIGLRLLENYVVMPFLIKVFLWQI
jgi:YggT family protein